MKITIEIEATRSDDGWDLRIDGHEWTRGLTTRELELDIQQHVTATQDCIIAEVCSEVCATIISERWNGQKWVEHRLVWDGSGYAEVQ